MDFHFNEEQQMLRKAAREFLERECPESVVREIEEDERGYSPESWQKIADLGWLGLVYPEKYGGSGGNFMDLTVLYEEIGRAMFPSPHLSTVVLCGLTILEAGSEKQKTELLARIAQGKLILSLAIAEPQSSWEDKAWDPDGVTLEAVPAGDGYVIDGTKLFVHDARVADNLLCVTRTKQASKVDDGITLFLVNARDPRITYTPLKTTAGDDQSEVNFSKVRVSAKDIVGRLHGGWPPLAKALQQARVLLCAEMVGAGQKLLELTVDYATNRIQFEQPIGANQYVQEHCVYLLSYVDGSRLVTYQAAWRISQNLPCDFEVAIAKAWTSEAHEKACWRAHQVYAGVGSALDVGVVPLYSRRSKNLQTYLGDTAYHLNRVAKEVDTWPAPVKPRREPLGIWDKSEDEMMPAWQPWQEYYESIRNRKEERRKRSVRK